METQLEDIIRKIQDEGVAAAESRAREIIDAAEKQAAERIKKAQSEAETIVKNGENEKDRLIASGEAALKQAGRDLVLAVQKRLTAMFEAVVGATVGEALTADRVGQIVVSLVEAWRGDENGAFEVLVSQSDREAIEATVRKGLGEKLAAGVEIRPVAAVTAGFRIGRKDGAVYYDFSNDSLSEMLAAFLNPRLGEVMKNAVGE